MLDSHLSAAGLPATACRTTDCRAKMLEPSQRGGLALEVLKGTRSATRAGVDPRLSQFLVRSTRTVAGGVGHLDLAGHGSHHRATGTRLRPTNRWF